uniref:Sortilin N-terminal domain-containing protein n=1 Tax=Solibacter usitatus (strain Ellin6076) TaxID=234267 RepID=Q02DB5_SOLUE
MLNFGRIVFTVLALILAGTFTLQPWSHAQSGDPVAALLADYKWRSIGPASAGGRIIDVKASDRDFRYAVVASASGGVWKTVNAGTTWTPIFDHYGAASIGAVAMFQANPEILWVGTGEANNRNSVAWGDGIYKSGDGGKTFQNSGLKNTLQIARIVTHPTDPNIVYVAALGNLWAYTGDRGVFKTADGGRTWQKLTSGLPADGKTGATDLLMDPDNPEVLYAAFYQRLRQPWRFDSGGPNGGIFKTIDGGKTWKKLTNGLPAGETGRIGLDIYRKNPKILMAIIEHGFQCGGGRGAAPVSPDCADMTKLGTGVYRSEDGGETWKFLNRYNNRPFYYSQIRINPSDDRLVYVLATSFLWSRDGGKTLTVAQAPFGPNYDHHAMWIDPSNKDRFYLGKDKGLTLTHDHGGSFIYFDNLPVAQFYKVATDMRDPYSIYGGTQDNGSVATTGFTRDVLGVRNDASWKMHWDDGQYVAVDPTDWRTVYSEGTVGTFRVVDPIGHTDTQRRPVPRNIANFQEVTGKDPVSPDATQAIRFNWTSPFILSPHDPKVLYYGTNYLLKTTDQGLTWRIVSRDLSKNDPNKNDKGSGGITPESTGAEGFATIYSISESPLTKGVIWAGTDDGNVWLTRDEGRSWSEVDGSIPAVPKGLWVSRVVASASDVNTAYVSFDGHRSDNRAPWLFRTTDGGKTWANLSSGLAPNQPVYVVEEDSKNPDLLLVGTEFGVQVSLDRGRTWRPMTNGLPTVAVYDIVIHPRDRDIILGTHGRGIYILDDITAIEDWRENLTTRPVHLFSQRQATAWVDMSRSGQMGDNTYAGQNPPFVQTVNFQQRDRTHLVNTPLITFYMGPNAAGTATLDITSPDGRTRSLPLAAKPGITRYAWDGLMVAQANGGRRGGGGRGVRGGGAGGGDEGSLPSGGGRGAPPPRLLPGTYSLKLTLGSDVSIGTLMVREDPILNGSGSK